MHKENVSLTSGPYASIQEIAFAFSWPRAEENCQLCKMMYASGTDI